MNLATLVDDLDREYRVADVRGDDWADIFAAVYPSHTGARTPSQATKDVGMG